MNITSIPTGVAFRHVHVYKGRKFKGTGYLVRSYENSFGTLTAKIWDPENGYIREASMSFVEDEPVSENQLLAAYEKYVGDTIMSTLEWCKSQKPNGSRAEIHTWARRILAKHHPEMQAQVDELVPAVDLNGLLDDEIREKIVNTINWAKGLRTKTCWMYGRLVGGKRYTPDRVVNVAKTALANKGLASLDNFNEIFAEEIRKAGLMA